MRLGYVARPTLAIIRIRLQGRLEPIFRSILVRKVMGKTRRIRSMIVGSGEFRYRVNAD